MEEEWTDIMQVCRNGHPINYSCIEHPERNQDYCEKCGKETITKCPNCGQGIPGRTHYPSVIFYLVEQFPITADIVMKPILGIKGQLNGKNGLGQAYHAYPNLLNGLLIKYLS